MTPAGGGEAFHAAHFRPAQRLPKLRSTGTRSKRRAANGRDSIKRLQEQLEARTREQARLQLAEAQRQASEALEQKTATLKVVRAENLDPDVLVMQPANQGVRHDASDLLNRARNGSILVQ